MDQWREAGGQTFPKRPSRNPKSTQGHPSTNPMGFTLPKYSTCGLENPKNGSTFIFALFQIYTWACIRKSPSLVSFWPPPPPKKKKKCFCTFSQIPRNTPITHISFSFVLVTKYWRRKDGTKIFALPQITFTWFSFASNPEVAMSFGLEILCRWWN